MKATSLLAIRRQVTIPKVVNKRNILAIIEVGGKLFSKDWVYQKIWELSVDNLEKKLKQSLVDSGYGIKDYDKLYNRAVKEVING